MKAKSSTIAIIILVVIFGSVAYTSVTGQWQTKPSKVPATYTEGALSGQYNPADIRGSYTFANIETSFGIPADELAAAFGIIGRDNAAIQVKEIETIYAAQVAQGKEVGTDSVRIFVALYKRLPITLTDSTYLPAPAVEILKTKANLTPEQLSYLDKHTVAVP
jgi:hypothetical protein